MFKSVGSEVLGERSTILIKDVLPPTPYASLLTPYHFIRVGGDAIQRHLQLAPLGVQFCSGRLTRHPDGVAPAIQAAAERVRDQEAIPARKEFFLSS